MKDALTRNDHVHTRERNYLIIYKKSSTSPRFVKQVEFLSHKKKSEIRECF